LGTRADSPVQHDNELEMTVMSWMRTMGVGIAAAVAMTAAGVKAQDPSAQAGDGKQDVVAALKQSLQDGQTKIRQYEWVETTIISMKGEEKSRKQNRCYYGADGKVQKVPVADAAAAAAPAPSGGGGGRGRRGGGKMKENVVENKKEEMQEYMQSAVKLIHGYVPPAPAQIQAAKDAGRVKVDQQPGGKVRIAIAQYLKPDDSLTMDLDVAANRLLGLGVDSYLDKPEDKVTLAVHMASLPDGAFYPAQTTLDAPAKNIKVVIQNSGHRPVSR
jgi:hypothetical protein